MPVEDRPSGTIEDRLLPWHGHGAQVTLAGIAKADGRRCYKLHVSRANGDQEDVYLDAETYLEVMIDVQPKASPLRVRTVYRDWKAVEGVMIAHTQIVTPGSFPSQRMTVEKVELNVPLDDAWFAPPPDAK